MKTLLLATFMSLGIMIQAQVTIDFENFNLEQDTFLNGSDLSGGFESEFIFLPNSYNSEFASWSDWSISNVKNDSVPGFGNQYASFAGSGAKETETYAVASAFQPVKIYALRDGSSLDLEEIYITNSTYAALSMQNGDAFSKVFGGETGNDPDYFLLTMKAYKNDVVFDSLLFYLADYRFEDNSQDYIIKDWTKIDLSSFSDIVPMDSLEFSLSSTDVGMFGMNTPAFFCIDQITGAEAIVSTEEQYASELEIFPNPAQDFIFLKNEEGSNLDYQIYSSLGRLISTGTTNNNGVNISALTSGNYFLKVNSKGKEEVVKFVKIE